MPKPSYPARPGPSDQQTGQGGTLLTPADTNAGDNLIQAGVPLLIDNIAGTGGHLYAKLPADGDVFAALSIERRIDPDVTLGVRLIGNAKAGFPPAGNFTEKVAYSGSVPSLSGTEYLQVLANGQGGVKFVKNTAGTGIGRVWAVDGGFAIIGF